MIIPSVEWARKNKTKTIHLKHNYKDFLEKKTTELANKLLVDPIQEEMRAKGVSRKIWENVEVAKVVVNSAGIYIRIHNEYFAESGFDVALAREEGTDDHFIQPLRDAQQFSRLDPAITSNLPKALSWIQNGVRRFSKGHWVSGLPRLNIIQTMLEKQEYELQTQLNDAFRKWKQDIMK